MNFLSPILESYIANSSEDEPELLQELTRETHLKVVQPRMITGHFQGRVLSMLSKIINPKYILEIGTYTGYSALCLAEGLQKDGERVWGVMGYCDTIYLCGLSYRHSFIRNPTK